MKSPRQLKVYGKFRTRTSDIITVPEIRLEGKWLEKLGFKEGQVVDIEETQNRLTITVRDGNK